MEEFQRIILVHYHEIGLKGRNRGVFEKRLQKNLEALLGAYPVVTIHRISGRLLVFLREGTTLEVANQCTDAILGVPGVARASCGFKCDLDIEVMGRAACIALAEAEPFSSFKVSARRNHTVFPIDSMQMNRDIGEVLCERFPEKRVQMKGQDVTVGVEAVEGTAYVYARSVRGIGGLPVGSSGKVVCLLSSGIDSPVATCAWPAAAPCPSASISRDAPRLPMPRSTWWTTSRTCSSAPAASGASTWCPSATTSARYPSPVRRLCGSSCTGASCSAWPRSWRGGKGLARW